VLFVVSAIISSAACGLFIAWGVDMLGMVPFSVLGTIIPINNAIAACILGLILTILLFPRIKKWDIYWLDVMPEADLPKGGAVARMGAYIMVAFTVICLPIALIFAYSIGGAQVPIVMIVARIGSIGTLVGAVMMN